MKSPQFSWQRLRGAYPGLGPEMRSTGEAAALGATLWEALLKSWLSVQGNSLPPRGSIVLAYTPTGEGSGELAEAAGILERLGYQAYTIEGMEAGSLEALGVGEALEMLRSGRVGIVLTTGYSPERDYRIRRAAADLGVPLVLNHKLAHMLAKAVAVAGVEGLEARELRWYWSLPCRGPTGWRLGS